MEAHRSCKAHREKEKGQGEETLTNFSPFMINLRLLI